jgi:hypothetical protein
MGFFMPAKKSIHNVNLRILPAKISSLPLAKLRINQDGIKLTY